MSTNRHSFRESLRVQNDQDSIGSPELTNSHQMELRKERKKLYAEAYALGYLIIVIFKSRSLHE